jgi:UDP-2,3-diacylglucosamine pyrophosphatase LpxH
MLQKDRQSDPAHYHLLIVSDLHLSEGRRPATNRYSTREDFFFDHEFARFLAFYRDPRREDGKPWHLIINGDLLDFLQVTTYDDAPTELRRTSRHLRYGLDCGEPETVYKLGKIAEGHPEFFLALAEFVADGNLLTVIKGNHDVEFHYPAVRAAFIARLKEACELARRNEPAQSTKIDADSVRFSDWFYYEQGLLWIEHGQQYDDVNVFPYQLSPLLPKRTKWPEERANEIDLPWGSLFVRYLFNDVETVEPFADNIKPQTEFVRWWFRRHPMAALKFGIFGTKFLLEKLRRAWTPANPAAYALRREQHEARLRRLAAESGITESDLASIDSLRARSLLKETSPLGWRIARRILSWHLLRPLLVLIAVLSGIGVMVAVSPLFAAVIPGGVRYLLWDRWNSGTAGMVLRHAVSVIRWFVFPIVVAANVLILRWLLGGQHKPELSDLVPKAREIARRLGVKAVLMGHTHDADLQSIGKNGEEYFNTGTWTKVFSEEERLIRDDIEFVFVQGLRGDRGLQLKLMEWDDAAGEPRLLKLFEESILRQETRG